MDSSVAELVDWDEFQRNLVNSILEDLKRLRKVWEHIGFEKEMLEDRCKQALIHFNDMSKMMIDEDEDLYERLVENVKTQRETLQQYCDELDIEEPEIIDGPPLFLKRQLMALLEKVSSLRQTRLDNLEELRSKEAELCSCLDVARHVFQEERPVPSDRDLEELSSHIQMLLTEKEERLRKYTILRKDILISMKVLHREASSSLEVELISELPVDQSEIQLGREKLSAMKALSSELDREKEERSQRLKELVKELSFLWEFLQQDKTQLDVFLRENGHFGEKGLTAIEKEIARCKDLRKANMGRFIKNLRLELKEWWDKCRASDEKKEAFEVHMTSDDFTEELLKIHEQEVKYWRNLYKQFESLFVKVEKIADLFKKTLQLQHRMTDKNRFYNRGGQLLQEEKERKKVLLLIPKMARELLEMGAQYEKAVGTSFLVGGETLEQYLQSQMDLIQQEKENDKLQRKQRKEEELAFSTPRKQHHLAANSLSVVRGMTLRSPALKPLGTTLTRNTPIKCQLLKSPMQPKDPIGTPYIRTTPQKRKGHQPSSTPVSAKLRQRSPSVVPFSYSQFEGPLVDPERSVTKRSTMNSTLQKVLVSKRTPMFTNSGTRRKRFSRSPKLPPKNKSRYSPRQPLSMSMKKKCDALKLAPTELPFLY